jgi:plastocyanin
MLLFALAGGAVRADTLLDQTSLIGTPGAAAPYEYSFTVAQAQAQALTLTLTDAQIPAAFGALTVAVTLGDTLVGTATVSTATPAPTVAIPAGAGTYTVHLAGVPAAGAGFGTFGVCVAPSSSPLTCTAAYSYSGTLYTPATPSSTPSSGLDTLFTSTVAGTYTVTITDDAFPVALQSISGGIADGSNPVAGLAAGTTQVQLAASNHAYTLIIGALADATVKAGLYGIEITDPNGNPVFNRTLPVGTLAASTSVDNPADELSLNLTDYGYPAPLAAVGVAVTQGSKALAALTAPGTVANFAVTPGAAEIWQYTLAGAQPGTYGLNLTYQVTGAAKPANLFSTTQVVNPTAGSGINSYAFVATIPAAGTYALVAADFQFPSPLQSFSVTVAQNGAVLPVTGGNFTAQSGAVVVLVNATPPAGGALGIFGVTVQTSGASPQVLLDQTQAVGGIFNTSVINLGTTGNFDVVLADLAFPQIFADLAVVVSQNSKVLVKIYGSGKYQLPGTPGQYVVSVAAIPSSQATAPSSLQNYGMYSLNISSSPPTVSLKTSATSVAAGGTVTLTWSSTSATSCMASGGTGWSGSEASSGSLALQVNTTETLSLKCTGPGGSAEQSVSVTATQAASGSSGGGGTLDLAWILMLTSLLAACAWRNPVRRPL